MAELFTRYQLRDRARTLGIEVRYGQFTTYIAKGLLPDPKDVPWIEEEIVPRFLHFHNLGSTARSLDRRVVILYLERYPVPPKKLQLAIAGMVKTIESPSRKMTRVDAADRWFNDHFSSIPSSKDVVLPTVWKTPRPSVWKTLLTEIDQRTFEHRLGIMRYHALQLATLGRGTPHALADIAEEERLVLLLVRHFAAQEWIRSQAKEREAATPASTWLSIVSGSIDPQHEVGE